MEIKKKQYTDRDMALIMGSLMRWGVYLALALALLGGIMYLYMHGHDKVSYAHFTPQHQPVPALLKAVWAGLLQLNGNAFILLGILLLFATPVLRVLFSLVSFMIEKDVVYIIITLIVLAIICISISGGLAH